MAEAHICLLRGINVGGRNKLPMADWRDMLAALGADTPKTYIQSGNAVFRGALAADAISDAIEAEKGFRPRAMVLSLAEYQAILDACPYRAEGAADPKSVHVWFVDGKTSPNAEKIQLLPKPNERLRVAERAGYLHAPDGIGKSKLAEAMEKVLGMPATARNWRSACAVRDLALSLK